MRGNTLYHTSFNTMLRLWWQRAIEKETTREAGTSRIPLQQCEEKLKSGKAWVSNSSLTGRTLCFITSLVQLPHCATATLPRPISPPDSRYPALHINSPVCPVTAFPHASYTVKITPTVMIFILDSLFSIHKHSRFLFSVRLDGRGIIWHCTVKTNKCTETSCPASGL